MDGPRDYHTSEVKPDRERQISYDIAYIWNLPSLLFLAVQLEGKILLKFTFDNI